jgi:hypothetical protein
MLDEKINPLFLFIQHQASSIQHRFASSNVIPKLIGSRFRVPACPGATGCGYAIVFSVYDFLAFQHRFASSNVIFTPSTRRFEAKLRWYYLTVIWYKERFFAICKEQGLSIPR